MTDSKRPGIATYVPVKQDQMYLIPLSMAEVERNNDEGLRLLVRSRIIETAHEVALRAKTTAAEVRILKQNKL